MVDSLYKDNFRSQFEPGKSLPKVSTHLDSVRAYQFEMRFYGLPADLVGAQQDLTLAAKQVGPISITLDDIVSPRINDKLFYPGQPTPDELSVTFDNLYLKDTSPTLWKWFKSIYDPMSGDMTNLAAPGGPGNRTFKSSRAVIMELDNTRDPHAAVELYGVYPKSVRFSEKNYSTNEFSTIEVIFRYDFMDYFKYASQSQ
tara:strand:- start:625 stop:1224 length:600 start_codon:yes stop_codon:yes gene_type:complete